MHTARILRVSALTPRLLSEVPKLCVRSTSHHMLRRYACPLVVPSAGRETGSYCRAMCVVNVISDVSQAVNSQLQPKFACAQVFELTREQERTKQAEASKEEAQYKVYAEQQRKVRLRQLTVMLTVMRVGSSMQRAHTAFTYSNDMAGHIICVHSNCLLYRKLKRRGGRSSARPCSRMRKPRHSWPNTRMS